MQTASHTNVGSLTKQVTNEGTRQPPWRRFRTPQVPDFGGCRLLGSEQGPVVGLRSAPLVIGACHVHPVAASPFGRRDVGHPEFFRVVDGGAVVSEHLGDAYLVEGDTG